MSHHFNKMQRFIFCLWIANVYRKLEQRIIHFLDRLSPRAETHSRRFYNVFFSRSALVHSRSYDHKYSSWQSWTNFCFSSLAVGPPRAHINRYWHLSALSTPLSRLCSLFNNRKWVINSVRGHSSFSPFRHHSSFFRTFFFCATDIFHANRPRNRHTISTRYFFPTARIINVSICWRVQRAR